mmetsp:Transcript_24119/g.48729  ORF Transcript_24119/g.48729 Transcript_24119/m.48729 type:complete len:204 (+) Transcript_24119:128-739(+)
MCALCCLPVDPQSGCRAVKCKHLLCLACVRTVHNPFGLGDGESGDNDAEYSQRMFTLLNRCASGRSNNREVCLATALLNPAILRTAESHQSQGPDRNSKQQGRDDQLPTTGSEQSEGDGVGGVSDDQEDEDFDATQVEGDNDDDDEDDFHEDDIDSQSQILSQQSQLSTQKPVSKYCRCTAAQSSAHPTHPPHCETHPPQPSL